MLNPNFAVLFVTSALRLLALRRLRTLRVRTRAFGPRFGEKLLLIFQVEYNIIIGINVPDYPIINVETTFLG